MIPLASISDAQRAPVPWGKLVRRHPSRASNQPLYAGSGRRRLSRISWPHQPEKGVERAVEIARRVGLRLKIAAKVDKVDLAYYNSKTNRLLKGPGVEFTGEIGEKEKESFLGGAMALLFPIDWPEPFGLVMIETMANGTPVVAFRRGAVPQVMDHGVTGIVVENVEEAVAMLPRALALDRQMIRRRSKSASRSNGW